MDDDLFQNLLCSLHEALAYAQGDTTKGKLHRWCGICRRKLDQPDDPKSIDCGGDCLGCIEALEKLHDVG